MTALARMEMTRDTAAGFTSDNPVLRWGEFGVETDTDKFKIGDGVTAWTALNYIRGGTNQTITLTGDVTGSGTGSFATALATAQPSAHTWAAAQTFSSSAKSTSPTAGIGYATGAGGAVTQATSKSTGVTLNAVCGYVTLNNEALAAGAVVTFVMTNSAVVNSDIIVTNMIGGGTPGAYMLDAVAGTGQITFVVRNVTAGSLSQDFSIGFAVVKGVFS